MNYNILVDIYGGAWAFGDNREGTLGLGVEDEFVDIPTRIPDVPPIKEAICGYNHSILIDVRGGVWSSGIGSSGQLGSGDYANRNYFQMINNIPLIVQGACGNSHTALLDINGQVWTFGSNGYGQLGYETNPEDWDVDDSNAVINATPYTLDFPHIIKNVGCCDSSTFIVDELGGVWSFGGCESGELGLGVDRYYGVINPEKIENIPAIRDIFCGVYQVLMIDYEGNVWGCGNKRSMGLEVLDGIENANTPQKIDGLPPILVVSSGLGNTLYLDHKYHVWGAGYRGDQLHMFDATDNTNTISPPKMYPDAHFVGIKMGERHIILVDDNGVVYSVGNNNFGQLGLGDDIQTYQPIVNQYLSEILPDSISSTRYSKTKSARARS